MLQSITMLLALAFFLPSVYCAFNGTAFEPSGVFSSVSKLIKIDEQTVYVAMGRHAILNCSAWLSAKNNLATKQKAVKWIFLDIWNYDRIVISEKLHSRFEFNKEDGSLILYTAQKENEGIYDCHVKTDPKTEWISRINVYVQDCDNEHELTSYRNLMNPCLYGNCTIAKYPNAPMLEYLKCNCVLQYTGEFCTKLVEGTVGREIFRFSPFIGHICSTLCILIAFFCCNQTSKRKKIISLENIAPQPRHIVDNPRFLYPAAMFPVISTEKTTLEAEVTAETIATFLNDLKNSNV